jgi:peroxiredoxin
MNKNNSAILGIIIVLALVNLSCAASGGPSANVGREAPDFTLTSAGGKEYRLSAFRGKPVVLNFFTTWCGPCRDEMPAMQSLFKIYSREGLILLAVDLGDSRTDVKTYASSLGLGFPLLMDPESQVGNLYGVNSFPRTFFIDSKGVIRKISIGSMPESEISAGMVDLIDQARTARETLRASGAGKGIEGCINVASALARTGPSKKYAGELKLHKEECFGFDARSADSEWLRLADLTSIQGGRLWAFADFIDLKAEVNTLPLEE